MEELTAKQSAVLAFIRGYIADHGYPPSIRDIGKRFKFKSPNGVVCHLAALVAKGKIRRDGGVSRGMVLLKAS